MYLYQSSFLSPSTYLGLSPDQVRVSHPSWFTFDIYIYPFRHSPFLSGHRDIPHSL